MHRPRIGAGRLVEDIWNENKFSAEFISIIRQQEREYSIL
jgi:hypothetical protein